MRRLIIIIITIVVAVLTACPAPHWLDGKSVSSSVVAPEGLPKPIVAGRARSGYGYKLMVVRGLVAHLVGSVSGEPDTIVEVSFSGGDSERIYTSQGSIEDIFGGYRSLFVQTNQTLSLVDSEGARREGFATSRNLTTLSALASSEGERPLWVEADETVLTAQPSSAGWQIDRISKDGERTTNVGAVAAAPTATLRRAPGRSALLVDEAESWLLCDGPVAVPIDGPIGDGCGEFENEFFYLGEGFVGSVQIPSGQSKPLRPVDFGAKAKCAGVVRRKVVWTERIIDGSSCTDSSMRVMTMDIDTHDIEEVARTAGFGCLEFAAPAGRNYRQPADYGVAVFDTNNADLVFIRIRE